MTFDLGIDLGTTFTAAAVARDGRVEMATLGDRSSAIPSVVMVRDDGTTLVGDAADRRAASDPSRVAREVKRRIGDPTPLILGGEPYSAAQLLARMLSSVVAAVSEREGGRPDGMVLTHPANWGPYKRELFESVPRLADLTSFSMISEPEAAAVHYASNARVPEGSMIAVYDLGGGTFDATVLRKLDRGFEFLGPPEGIEGLGGIDFDEAVFAYVDRCVDGALGELDLDDPQDAAALVRLRRECVLAKEALSADTETSISVLLPNRHTDVRLTRAEFEEMIRPPIESTVSALRRALLAAQVDADSLSNVLLVGGSSRIPLVSQMLSAELGRPTVVDTHPKHAVALGAALMVERRRASHGGGGPQPTPQRPPTPPHGLPVPVARPSTPPGGTPRPQVPVGHVGGPSGGRRPADVGSGPRSGLIPVAGALGVAGGAAATNRVATGPSSGGIPTQAGPPRPHTGPPTGPPTGSHVAPAGAYSGPPSGRIPSDDDARTTVSPMHGAAGSAPPSLGRSTSEEQDAATTRKRRLRTAAIGIAAAAVLAAGGVATAAALTGSSGGPPAAPAPAAVSSVPAGPALPPGQAAVPAAAGGTSGSAGGAPITKAAPAPAPAPVAVQGGSSSGRGGTRGSSGWTTTSTSEPTKTTTSAPSTGTSGGGTSSGGTEKKSGTTDGE